MAVPVVRTCSSSVQSAAPRAAVARRSAQAGTAGRGRAAAAAVVGTQFSHTGASSSRIPRHSALAEAAATATPVLTHATALPQLPPLDDDYQSNCAFNDFGNWLIPGRVMLGRYPFVEPSRCRSRPMGEEQLRKLITSGITTFVCLQAELPEQAAIRIGGVDGFLPYRPSATLMATTLSPPPSLEEVSALRTPQLDRYLPPRRRPTAWSQRKRIELDFVHCPIVDLGVPETDRLRLLLADITRRLEDGENLYIHCWGGRGRAGTVGACLLAHLYGVSAEEALTRIQLSFDTRKDEGRRSPETDEQHAYVKSFIEQYGCKA